MSLYQKIEDLTLTLTYPFIYFGQWTKDKVIYEIDGCKFKLRVWTSDKNVVWEVFKMGEYSDSDHFKIKPSDVVVDIGGHIGVFTVFAARKAKKVYVYEALKENYDLLNENVSLNKLNNVKSFNVAVSDKIGTETFFVGKGNRGGNSFYKKSFLKTTTKVPTITLQKIFSDNNLKRINLLKLDVEGAEYKILLSSPPELIKKIDRITLEFHDNIVQHHHNYKDLVKFLEDNGFEVKVSIPFIARFSKTGRILARLIN